MLRVQMVFYRIFKISPRNIYTVFRRETSASVAGY